MAHLVFFSCLLCVLDDEWEYVKESKKKRKKKRIRRISKDSEDTVNYSLNVPEETNAKITELSDLAVGNKQCLIDDETKHDESENPNMVYDLEVKESADLSQLGDRKLSCDSAIIVDQSDDNNQSPISSVCKNDGIQMEADDNVTLVNGSSVDNEGSSREQSLEGKTEESDSGYDTKHCDKVEKANQHSQHSGKSTARTVKPPEFKNIFTEKPEVGTSQFECLCGESSLIVKIGRKNRRLHPVQCSVCSLWQHAECVNYDVKDPYRGEFKCPHCHAAAVSILLSH